MKRIIRQLLLHSRKGGNSAPGAPALAESPQRANTSTAGIEREGQFRFLWSSLAIAQTVASSLLAPKRFWRPAHQPQGAEAYFTMQLQTLVWADIVCCFGLCLVTFWPLRLLSLLCSQVRPSASWCRCSRRYCHGFRHVDGIVADV